MKTSIIYVRVSREKDGEKELSVVSQRERCEEKAKKLNAEVVRVFVDRDKTGRNNNRPQFQAALDFCKHEHIDYFIVWSTSRFARNITTSREDTALLASYGTTVKFVTTEVDNSSSSRFLLTLLQAFDEHQSDVIGEDTRRSMIKNAADGYFNGGRVSFGFSVIRDSENKQKKRLTINQDEAQLVKTIFQMRLSGAGAKTIADQLNTTGQYNRGQRWTKKSITALLRNEKVIGVSIFNRRNHNKIENPPEQWIVVKSHEAIIDDKTWQTVQEMMADLKTYDGTGSPKSTWSFTGLLQCGTCKKTMHITSGKGRSKTYYYYTCQNKKSGYGCSQPSLPAEKIEQWLTKEIYSQIITPQNLANIAEEINRNTATWAAEYQSEKIQAQRQLEKLKTNNARLYDILEDPTAELNMSDLAPRIRANNKQIEKMKKHIAALETRRPVRLPKITPNELAEFLYEQAETATPSQRRQFLRTFIESMQVTERTLNIEYHQEALMMTSTMIHSERNWLPEQAYLRTTVLTLNIPACVVGRRT